MVTTNAQNSSTNKRPRKKPRTMPKTKSHNNLRFQANTVGSAPELKNCDTVSTVSTAGSGAFLAPVAATLINGIAQGTTENQRVGRKVVMKSLLVNFFFTPSAGTLADSFRVLIIYDKQPIGVFPAVTDILVSSSVLSPMNLSYSDRFTVLSNTIINQYTPMQNYLGSIYLKLGLDGLYSSTGALIANINTGAIYIMVADSSGAGADVLTFFSRIRYTDA